MDIPLLSPAFGWIIRNIYNVFDDNYLLTLFLFAVIIKVLLLPFGIKQQKNSIKQARMRPKEMAIRKKYAGRTDRATQQKMSQEIMQLYQDEHISPFSGCLPLLLQMPILFALYGVIIKPLTYISVFSKDIIAKIISVAGVNEGQEIEAIRKIMTDSTIAEKVKGMGDGIYQTIADMSNSFYIFGMDLTRNPAIDFARENLPYLLIPVLTFVFSFASTKIIRKFTYQPQMTDESQARSMSMMDWMMPILSVWISFNVSSAIAIYWIFQNVLSAVQQIVLFKLYPIPEITPEQIKEAELALKGKSINTKKQTVAATYEIDDYDKTENTDKSGSKNQSKKNNEFSVLNHTATLSPKLKAYIKETGKVPKAKRKI